MSAGHSHRSVISHDRDRLSLFLGLIVPITALPLGSNRSPWWLLWTAVFAAVAAIFIVRSGIASTNYRSRFLEHKGLVGLVLFLPLWAIVQSLPVALWLPTPILVALPPSFFAMPPGLAFAAGPAISIQPEATLSGVLRFFGYILLICLVIEVASQRARVLRLGQIAYTGVCLQAIWAVFALKLLGDPSPWGPKLAYLGSATGTFINRNSLATFLGLGIVLGIGLLGERAHRYNLRSSRKSRWIGRVSVGDLLLVIGLSFLSIALVYTQSRLGLAASLAGAAMTLSLIRLKNGASTSRVLLEAVVLSGVAVIAVGLLSGWGGVAQRLLLVSSESVTRLSIYAQTLSMISVRPWTGFGMDAFGSAFEAFRGPPLLEPVTYDMAHNSYLMLWSEFGVIFGSVPMVVLVIVALRLAKRMRSKDGFAGLAAASLGALVLGAVHSAGDFSLEIPANVYLLVTIIGLGIGRRTRHHSAPSGPSYTESSNDSFDAAIEFPRALQSELGG